MLPVDPRYLAARRVLLDALEALAPHGPALIVAGAQAVYLHTGALDIGIAPYTTDGDLAVDPTLLASEPELAAVMKGADFHPDLREPGIWLRTVAVDDEDLTIPIDLIVPEGAAPPGGRRGAQLGPHGSRAARKAVGLEAALVDHTTMTIASLEPSDDRSSNAKVAGRAALLVSKAHKIHDRLASRRPERVEDKDASDVYRLMQTSAPSEIGERLAQLQVHEMAGPVTTAAVAYLTDLFGRRQGEGVRMASRALRIAVPEDQIEVFAPSFINRMLEAIPR